MVTNGSVGVRGDIIEETVEVLSCQLGCFALSGGNGAESDTHRGINGSGGVH